MKYQITWLCIIFLLCSCEPNPERPSGDPVDAYFPLRVGAYSIFQVDSTVIQFNVEQLNAFQLRVSVVDSFQNATGGITYLIQREKRSNEEMPWIPAGTWSARKTLKEGIVSEGNISYVRLKFPPNVNLTWNGNEFNSEGGTDNCPASGPCDLYKVSAQSDSFSTDEGLTVGPVVEITQSNDPDVLVKYDVRKEVYAKNVGLVYKEITLLDYCTQGNCFGQQIVNAGLRYKQELLEYEGWY